MKSADVLLLTTEQETATAVREAVKSAAFRGSTNVCKSMLELRTRLSTSGRTRTIALVDIDEEPQQMLFALTKTITATPDALFVVVSREFNEKLVLQAMQAGARHFIRKSAIATELDAVLGRLLLHEPRHATQMGDVISIFSCSGGCGATTVAVNIATELKLAGGKPVLLVDLDPHYGSIAQYLNVQSKYGVAHILNRDGTIDRHLIESSAARYIEGLDVLLSPAAAEADKHKPMNYDNLLRVLEACRESYGYVVVDSPRLPHDGTIALTSVSGVAIIVLRLAVRDVAFAKSLIASLTEQGMASDRILLLANQAKRRGGLLSATEVQKALGKPLFRVRSDWRKAAKSITYGQPLAHSARMSGLRRDLRKVTGQIRRWTSNGHPEKGGA